jgi:phosphoribosylamine-glycine ligase
MGSVPNLGGGGLANASHLVTSGSYVLVSTGTGESVVEARTRAYRVLDRLTIPASPFWRIDIGARLRSGLDKLQTHGFATGMRYA